MVCFLGFLLVIVGEVGAVGFALADTPTSPRSHLTPIPDFQPLRGGASLGGVTSGTAGVEYTFTVNNGTDEGVVYYRFAVAILDNTHPNGAADTMYDEYKVSPRTVGELKYTFYTAGTDGTYATYGIWCYRYDENMTIIPWVYKGNKYDFIYKQVRISASETPTALDEEVSRIAADCLVPGDEYATVLEINNYLMQNVTYDNNQQYYSPEAALLNGLSVCNGYSRAFALIAEACGLEARRAVGDEHAWDVVQMDGEWYYVDPTWNCTTESHRYLGVNEEILAFDHTLENTVGGSVSCTSLVDNYYVRSGKWELLATEIQPVMEEMVGNRLHIFRVSMGDETYTEYEDETTSSSAQKNVNGHVVAYVYSNQEWTVASTGETFSTDFIYDYSSNTVNGTFTAEGTLILPEELDEIEEEVLAGVDAYYVVIPNGCTTIGANAISDSKVWDVTIPASVTEIDEEAFEGTLGLTIRTTSGSPAARFADRKDIPVVIE